MQISIKFSVMNLLYTEFENAYVLLKIGCHRWLVFLDTKLYTAKVFLN